MDSLEINKIIAAVLTTGIVAMFSGFVASSVVHPEELDEPVYLAAGAAVEEAAGEVLPEEAPAETVVALLAAADAAAGQAVAKKCKACHTFDQGGANRLGPNLWGIVNRQIAGVADFNYSPALRDLAGGEWTFEDLDAFLTKPKDYAKGTKMSFGGLKKPEVRANLIAYLRSLSDSPAALPE